MPAEWPKLHRQAVEEMLRIADSTEDYVYDDVVPMLFELDDPEARLTFYNGLDMEALKQGNPKLWQRYSQDALKLQDSANQQSLDALDQLRSEQQKNWADFSRQVDGPTALGLRSSHSEQPTWENTGMEMPLSMGRFGE